MTEGERRILREGAAQLGFSDPALLERIERYHSELELWNGKLRLVDASGEALVVRHLLDCLAAVPVIRDYLAGASGAGDHAADDHAAGDHGPGARPGAARAGGHATGNDGPGPLRPGDDTAGEHGSGTRPGGVPGDHGPDARPAIADLGSGAGLPGILLALALPETAVTLVERRGRRCGFLRNCRAVLGAENVEVLQQEFESLPADRFDLLSSRAFAPLDDDFVGHAVRTLKPGGVGVFLKGTRARIDEELASLTGASTPGASPGSDAPPGTLPAFEVVPVEVPFLDEQRHLVIMTTPRA